MFHGEREILASAHKDWVSEHTLEGPCRVHTLGEFQALRCVTATDYFSRTEYRPQALDFRPDRVEVYCVCEMPYNPDQFMVECSLCKEWCVSPASFDACHLLSSFARSGASPPACFDECHLLLASATARWFSRWGAAPLV